MARDPRILARAALAAALVMSNWLVFVWAVNAGRILETSLGYFITPLVSILLGVMVLGERLRPRQWVAVACACLGVALEGWRVGGLPWMSLPLAATFGSYGLLRKQLPVDAAGGLPLATMGFLQYTAPLLTFLVAIFLYGEAMNLARLFAFAAIWAGLALYTADLMLQHRPR